MTRVQVPLEQGNLAPLPPNERVKPQFLELTSLLSAGGRGLIRKCLSMNLGHVVAGAALRLAGDLLGFTGALGIQVIVSSLQRDVAGRNGTDGNMTSAAAGEAGDDRP